jgi:hypothetical protein
MSFRFRSAEAWIDPIARDRLCRGMGQAADATPEWKHAVPEGRLAADGGRVRSI